MDAKGKERGILKLDPKPRVQDTRLELTTQASRERLPVSPQPSVDRLSVTWAEPDPGSMASSANIFHLPSEPASEVKFSSTAGEGSEDEDYSASLSAVLRQRRASVRRSRKGRTRRPSSPFLPDESRPRRRSSVFTTSSGDTAISMEESQPAVVSQEQIFENIHLHKEVLGSVKQQPLGMRRKLKLVHQAKAYIKRHEGQLQERLAQSKSTRDIYARLNILLNTKWQQMKREAANTSNLLIPWELRIKEIESHFGSVVASYFTFLRWLFWVNLVIAFILLVFVIVPEYLTANPLQDGERKIIMEEEKQNSSNLLTLWEFEGILKFSPIFYGYYSNVERPEYRMPLAYFLTGLVVYIYSFVAILRKMAENSRMSKLSEKEDECIFSWKLFTGWDFMIGNAETAHNRIASVILGFKEALLEEAEKKKDLRNWRIISLRAIVNICVVFLLVASACAVVHVVSESDNHASQYSNWWRENQTTIVVTVISITFPVFFELLGLLEHYHPRKQLRLQLARIMLLNLLNLYSLIFALFSKIEGMSRDLDALKPQVIMNGSNTLFLNESLLNESFLNASMECYEIRVSCAPCNISLTTFYPDGAMPDMTAQTTTLLPLIALKANQVSVITRISTSSLPSISTTPMQSSWDTTASMPQKSEQSLNTTLSKMTILRLSPIETTLQDNSIPNTTIETPKILLPQNLIQNNVDPETTTDDPIEKELKFIQDMYLKNSTDSVESTEDENEPFSFYDEDGSKETTITDYVNGSDFTQSIFSTNGSNSTISTDTDITENFTSGTSGYKKITADAEVTESIDKYSVGSDSISSAETVTSSTATESESTVTDSTAVTETGSTVTENTTATDNESTVTDDTTVTGTDSTVTENATVTETESTVTDDTTVTGIDSTVTDNTVDLTVTNDAEVTLANTITDAYTDSSTESTAKEKNKITNVITSPYTQIANTVTVTEPTISKLTKTSNQYTTTTSTISYTKSSNMSSVGFHTIKVCPSITFNCTIHCEGRNVTHVFIISNCTLVEKKCYKRICNLTRSTNTTTLVNTMRVDDPKRKTYNLTIETKKRLLKLCWETMFGQELVKLTMMDLVFVLLGTLFMDFFRALFVRYMNRCWCWDLEKKFPEYGDFKIAENILHLINNQGLVWMGMFFSPGLVVINVSKLMIMMYLRSWAVMTCNVPHEVVFRVSKSNNFYLALLLTMLFLCVLPVGYTIVWVKPSWHCGPFSEYDKIYYILTSNIYKILPTTLNFALELIASPAIVIPLLVLLVLIIYYLTSLTNSLREANNDLKIQLRRERTEERRKMFQLADTRRAGSSALDNTPFARWKKALPALPLNKSVDSDDRKVEGGEPIKAVKKRGGLLAKIVGLALDKKTEDVVSDDIPPSPNNVEDETDTDFHETLPREVLKIKDITIFKPDHKKKNNVEFKTDIAEKLKDNLKVNSEDERSEKRPERPKEVTPTVEDVNTEEKQLQRKQTTDSTSSKQSDSFSSVIPVITISTTESDDELLHSKKETKNIKDGKIEREGNSRKGKSSGLRRQSSVDSANGQKLPKEKKTENVGKYQHSL